MSESQEKARVEFHRKDLAKKALICRLNLAMLRSSENDKDGGSRGDPQGPDEKHEKEEVKPLSAQNGQQAASPHQAQGVVNVAPGEGPPKQVTYDELTNQVIKLMDQIKTAGTDAEIDALGKKIADIEAELGRKATKKGLTQKLTELSRKLSESAADAQENAKRAEDAKKGKKGDGDAEDLPGAPKGPDQAETAESAGRKATGKGIISTQEMDTEQNGPSAPWFKDILKANAKLGAEGRTTFSS
jgi:hypothetical protein